MKDIRKLCYEAITAVDNVQNIEYSKVTDETEIYGSDFGLDSLALTELISILEQKFNIEIDDDELMDMDAFENFGSLCRYISKKTQEDAR